MRRPEAAVPDVKLLQWILIFEVVVAVAFGLAMLAGFSLVPPFLVEPGLRIIPDIFR